MVAVTPKIEPHCGLHRTQFILGQKVAVTPKIEPHCGRFAPCARASPRNVAVTPKIEPHCGTTPAAALPPTLSQSHLKLNLTAGMWEFTVSFAQMACRSHT